MPRATRQNLLNHLVGDLRDGFAFGIDLDGERGVDGFALVNEASIFWVTFSPDKSGRDISSFKRSSSVPPRALRHTTIRWLPMRRGSRHP